MSTSNIQTGNLFKNATFSALTAAAVNAVLYYIFSATGTIDPALQANGQSIQITHILMSSIMPTFIAALVFLLIGRFSKQPWKIFRIIAIVLLVLTFANPFVGIPGITLGMGLVLNLMHLVVFAPILYFFPKSLQNN